jgi:hypothetical protein
MARSVWRYLPPLAEKQNLHSLMMGIERMNGCYDAAFSPVFPQAPAWGTSWISTRRLVARPASLSLLAIGWLSAKP